MLSPAQIGARVFSRPVLLALFAAWAAVVASSTLAPPTELPLLGIAPDPDPEELPRFLCFGCGARGIADIILNWLMFVPGGALLAFLMPGRRVLVVAALMTVAIETLQIGIPGRNPALQDIVFNTVGALSGVLLARRGLRPVGQRLLIAVLALAWLAPLGLSLPVAPTTRAYGLYMPLRDGRQYAGQVQRVSVGGVDVPWGEVPERAALIDALLRRAPVTLDVVASAPPPEQVSIFLIADDPGTTVVTVDAAGHDLIIDFDNASRLLRFDQPGTRAPGALEGVEAGDTVRLVVERARSSTCVSVDERTTCGLGPGLGAGWAFLLRLDGLTSGARSLLHLLWPLGLGLLIGASAPNRRAAAALGLGIALVGWVSASVSLDVRPSLAEAGLLAIGALVGARLRKPIGKVWAVGRAGTGRG